MARLESALQKQINHNILPPSNVRIESGEVISYDSHRQTVDVLVKRPGYGNKKYGSIAWSSLGKGLFFGEPVKGDTIVLAFLGENDSVPVVLNCVNGNLLSPRALDDVGKTKASTKGRLTVERYTR